MVARKKLCRKQNFWPPKTLLVPIPHEQPVGWPGTAKLLAFTKRTNQGKQAFEFKMS
jgi:hypothetical protein